MLTIPRHGVINSSENPTLSYAQQRLISDPAPIRLCGAPTGAGKTFAFQQASQQGQLVFFVVPTQALAKDIHSALTQPKGGAAPVPAVIWDANQTLDALERGTIPWMERKTDLERLAYNGGMIIATLEALANLTLGKPKHQQVPMDLIDMIWKAQHLVFDESHTLNHRAFGLLHLWATIIAFRHQQKVEAPKLSLLSATPSNLFEPLLEAGYIPKDYVACFDEAISEIPDRPIHGNVDINLYETTLLEVARREARRLLSDWGRLLLIYDSLAQFANDETELCNFFIGECGLRPDEIIVINGQDRQANISLGGSGCDVGLNPMDRHQVIIGTSAVEMGVNFAVDALISDPGADAAALLQRIGRIARGDRRGVVHITCSANTIPDHLLRLGKLSGRIPINQLREYLQPLRSFDGNRAKTLGSAYWSMLERQDRYLMRGIKDAFASLTGDLPAPGRFLNKLHMIADQQDWRGRDHYRNWLKTVDRTLQDVRGFAPTIRVQFKDMPPITYNADWVAKYLGLADRLQEGVYCYDATRSEVLRETPAPISFRFISPVGACSVTAWNTKQALNQYIDELENCRRHARRQPGFEEALEFIRATRLLTRDPKGSGQELIDSDVI